MRYWIGNTCCFQSSRCLEDVFSGNICSARSSVTFSTQTLPMCIFWKARRPPIVEHALLSAAEAWQNVRKHAAGARQVHCKCTLKPWFPFHLVRKFQLLLSDSTNRDAREHVQITTAWIKAYHHIQSGEIFSFHFHRHESFNLLLIYWMEAKIKLSCKDRRERQAWINPGSSWDNAIHLKVIKSKIF